MFLLQVPVYLTPTSGKAYVFRAFFYVVIIYGTEVPLYHI